MTDEMEEEKVKLHDRRTYFQVPKMSLRTFCMTFHYMFNYNALGYMYMYLVQRRKNMHAHAHVLLLSMCVTP